MMAEENDLGNLNDYMGPAKLTAELCNKADAFECIDITKDTFPDQKSPVLKLHLQRSGDLYFINLNKTNLNILAEYMQDEDIKAIKDLIGYGFYFDKRKVTNPNDGKLMDSLFIDKIADYISV